MFTDALLVAIIILILYMYMTGSTMGDMQAKATNMAASVMTTPASSAASPTSKFKVENAERKMMADNQEHFAQNCIDTQIQPPLGPCDCDSDSSFPYARAEYGPSGDYTTWVMNQTIDPTVAANHKEFISDRTGENSSVNVIGRTYTPADSHQSYTPLTSWIGIRGRPSLVPVCSPDQVNDVNYGYFPVKQVLNWNSTSTYSV